MPPFAGHHTQALEILNQVHDIAISEVQQMSDQPHFYGYIYNGDNKEKVRVFPGFPNKPDLKLAELLKLQTHDIQDEDLRLKVEFVNHWPDKSIRWTARAQPMEEQSQIDQKIVDRLLSRHALETAQIELRSPADVVSSGSITITVDEPEQEPEPQPQQITSRNQSNQAEILAMACYEGRNPYELLTRSTARVEGKTDHHLMVFLRVVADKLGVEVCDLINEVMWEAVKSGRVWDCQKGNGMP